ncbi:MAG: dihydrolipoyl dehydrogenase [Sedimentisphaerales bacterium]|nr:dihydrolipoyl dehydrogenase [Sedimentisphaerales bacterium]
MAEKFDVAVIGSGPGGYAAAIRAAQRGAAVAIVEKDLIGGTCLNRGCIPSKTLLASAHTLLSIRNAKLMGIDTQPAIPNWPNIQKRKEAVVTGFRKGLTGLLQGNKIKIFEGTGIVTAPGKITVKSDSSTSEFEANNIILATGSKSVEIPTIPFNGKTIISSTEALSLAQIPRSMVIVGGGVIGCEMACVYAAMGTKVTIVEALSRLIPMEDEWVGRLIEREFKKLAIESFTGRKVVSVDTAALPSKVSLDNGLVIEAEKVLVSVGRRATVDKETVEALGLQMNGRIIAVDKKMRTNVPGVYAIGDVLGTTYLAHGAFAEAEIAATNATGGNAEMHDYNLIPRAVYTFPEIASVGKSEEKCLSEGLDISVGKSSFKANGRSIAHNEMTGEVRVIKENSTNKILGVSMVGATVTELLGAARAIIGTSENIFNVCFPHPTVSEVLKEAAEDAFGLSIHNPPK